MPVRPPFAVALLITPAAAVPPAAVSSLAAEGFDEGAAQVRRLLDRDRKELDFDELDKTFAPKGGASPANASEADAGVRSAGSGATPSSDGAKFAADKTPVSPFGPPASSGASPFMVPGTSRKPFAEPAGLSPTMQPAEIEAKPWWTKITLTQVVSGCSCALGVLLSVWDAPGVAPTPLTKGLFLALRRGPGGARPPLTPPWPRPSTATQVIVLSFTSIISLMIATFFVVLNMGAIRINE